MSKKGDNTEQDDQSPFDSGLQLDLLAAVISTLGGVIGILALLDGIEEEKVADELAQQEQDELDRKLEKMQAQIDRLTNELSEIKTGVPYRK